MRLIEEVVTIYCEEEKFRLQKSMENITLYKYTSTWENYL